VCMNLPLMNGAMTILNETFSEKRVMDILENEPISMFPAVPAIYQRIYDVYGGSGKNFSKIKAFIPGGAPLDLNLLQKFILAFNANVFEGYGITECGPVTSVNPIDRHINKPGSVGLPLHGISVKVVDPDDNELPPRTQGELCIYGKNVMKGYLNQPEMTRKYLRNGWLHTGDRAWLDEEGFIFLSGVIKEMFLVGGFNVYPAEVQMVLNQHPDVDQSELYSVKDPSMGERIIAKVKLRQGSKTTSIELRKYARANLAPYKVPRAIEII
jgi:long-chain acyl-CoA synthetase